jgi:hypothetical protein
MLPMTFTQTSTAVTDGRTECPSRKGPLAADKMRALAFASVSARVPVAECPLQDIEPALSDDGRIAPACPESRAQSTIAPVKPSTTLRFRT